MSTPIKQFLASLCRKYYASKNGQTLVEYALVLCIITLIAVGVFAVFGQHLVSLFSAINGILDTAQSSH